MPYQLLILRKDWFTSHVTPDKFRVLSQILNKGYSKPMAQYGVIESPRIKSHHDFLDSLQLDSGSAEAESSKKQKDFVITLSVGSHADFETLKSKSGYVRRFNSEIWPLNGSRDSDIPPELSGKFGPLTPENIEHVTLSPTDHIDSDIANRVLATLGLKTYSDDGYFSALDKCLDTKHYELTALTSFMRGMGKGLIDYVIVDCLAKQKAPLFDFSGITKIVLHAIVIKEHELVSFYKKACGFVSSAHPEVLVQVTGQNSPLEDGIKASRGFSICFLRKEMRLAPA